jgi:phosphocarrier protein
MISKDYIILAADGIHARPATALIRMARQFKSVVQLKKDEKIVKLNSILNILSLSVKFGETLTVLTDGEDELEAQEAIGHFFNELMKYF